MHGSMNVKCLKQFGWDGVHWIQLAVNRDRWWVLVKKGTLSF